MKVQIQRQELRFRIDEAELAALLGGHEVVNATSFGPHSGVLQRLGMHAETSPVFEEMHGQWHVLLPERALREHAQRLPCKDALTFELAYADGVKLNLRFDVDVRDSARVRRGERPGEALA